MNHSDIQRHEEIFKKHPPRVPQLAPRSDYLAPGQIWTLVNHEGNDSFAEIVVLGYPSTEEGLETVEVAPLVHDATIAGPKDYIMPEDILCHHAVVLVGMDFSLPTGNLKTCQGSLKSLLVQKVLDHHTKVKAGTLSGPECHAPDFVDSSDFRYVFQELAAEQLDDLQKEIYQKLDELVGDGEKASSDIPVIQAAHLFREVMPAFGLAAAGADIPDSLKSVEIPFRINGSPALLMVRQSIKAGHLALMIQGDPDHVCAKVMSSTGAELAGITEGQTRFAWSESIGDAITIADASGAAVVILKLR